MILPVSGKLRVAPRLGNGCCLLMKIILQASEGGGGSGRGETREIDLSAA